MAGMLLCSNVVASPDDLRYSGLEQRLATLEAQMASQQGVRSAGYLDDGGARGPQVCDTQPICHCDDGGTYFEFQMLWMRPHINELVAGKLSEEHYFSPRWIIGYEDACGIGVRSRYWRFDHSVDADLSDSIRIGMDVLDVEATNHLDFHRTDLVLGGGIRMADMDLAGQDGEGFGLDALGMTLAADARTQLWQYCRNQWAWVYGGRVAILGGDWNGNEGDVRDDNLMVHELYAGLEHGYSYSHCDVYTRIAFEMQNWHSDFLGTVSATDSVGFVGPGVHLGASF
jgi:hypothetical protein